MTVLDDLSNDTIAFAAALSSASGIRRALLERPEVLAVRNALVSGELTEADVKEWVDLRFGDFQPGERFEHDLAFAALAVALEPFAMTISDLYLDGLSDLSIREMPLSAGVARISRRERWSRLTQNSLRSKRIVDVVPEVGRSIREPRPQRIQVGSSEVSLTLQS